MSAGSSGAVLVERITAPVRGMHRAISSSWFERIGPVGSPVRIVHDSIVDLTYASILTAASVVGPMLDTRIDPAAGGSKRLQAVVNSLWGDDLGIHRDRVAVPMTAHIEHETADRLVVLVHGISDTDACWSGESGLLGALEEHPEITPVTLRYNAGLSIANNGARLAALLDDIVTTWPVPVESMALVGYSMGALVIHHALAAGHVADRPWATTVSDVVSIGGPHRGSPIERTVAMAARALAVGSTTRPLADFLDSRSTGIKDLGGASPVPDWDRPDLDTRFHFIAGVITTDPMHPIGALAGDLVVTRASGTEPSHLEPTSTVTLGGTHHLDLLRDPAVIAQTLEWITSEVP